MTPVVSRSLLAAGLLVAGAGLHQSSGRLLVGSMIYEREVAIASGQTWSGLFRERGGWRLEPVTVRVVLADTECGRMVRVESGRTLPPLFLVRDVRGLAAGAVAGQDTTSIVLRPGESHAFSFAGTSYRFVATGSRVPQPRDYELRLERLSDGRAQALVNSPATAGDGIAGPPRIHWIGDLDHDDRPDLLIDVRMYETPPHWVLFLSGQAGQGQLVRRVAEHARMDC